MAEFRLKVRYSETGAEGFAYYGSYNAWYDMAQNAFLEHAGTPYAAILRRGLHFVPIQMNSRFYAPAYFGDDLTVSLRVCNVSSIKAMLEYTIRRDGDGASIATCAAVYACMDADFRPVVFKKELPELYAALCAAVEQ